MWVNRANGGSRRLWLLAAVTGLALCALPFAHPKAQVTITDINPDQSTHDPVDPTGRQADA